MSEAPLHRLLLGDNQFFGINHMSEERARALKLYATRDNPCCARSNPLRLSRIPRAH
jgi:hypothetical protein